jgi:hypothetical protein
MIAYLNDPAIRKALHIPNHVEGWDLCRGGSKTWSYKESPKGSQWIYEALKDKYRMLHYSGDTDGSVPALGTIRWVEAVGWPKTSNWTAFYPEEGKLGGYYEDRGKFTLMTIHGAGHMAPQFKRAECYYGVFNWLLNRPL